MWFEDGGRRAYCCAGDYVRAVGWLSKDRPFPIGDTPEAVIGRLREFVMKSGRTAVDVVTGVAVPEAGETATTASVGFWLFKVLSPGVHTCEFCDNCHGAYNFGIPAGDLLWVAPEMIVHYIAEHRYQPPAEFLAALERCPMPGSGEYREAAWKFASRHPAHASFWNTGK